VVNGECTTDFKEESEGLLIQQYDNCKVKFMNDVQGMAFGVSFRKDDSQFVRIENPNSSKLSETHKSNNFPKILLTIGTGTGLSIIYPYKNDPQPLILPAECWGSNLSPDV
jgi:hypothetical protein